ncbi:small integral membrane protein 26 [Engystomops pustulosus]|uniref:small integral membrane protein 26 n=1 Tax=Engystomops pustulosus TaxID=76066 RepID=UPI003AFB4492
MVRLGHVLRIHTTEVRRLAFWRPTSGENWRSRMALTYALSVWSMIGFVAFMEWTKKDTFQRPKADEEFPVIEDDPVEKRKQRFEISTSVKYRENQVPFSTKIYEYFTSSNKTSDSGSSEN